ncbi:MAG: glycosyltransferase family 2 protein [Rhodanobacteraceae bacterium]|nr:MAG: glycosyltransferase family 2 protein [Rhodanobacteraceae bacterium]
MPVATAVGLVLHFRTPAQTIACLHSLAEEGVQRIVVVDNSEDNGRSVACMGEALDVLQQAGTDIKVLTPDVNLGFARGVHEGVSDIVAQGGAHVLLINSDARLRPGALRQMLQALRDSAVIAPRVTSAQGAADRTPIVYYFKLAALYLRRPYFGSVRYPSGTCLLIRQDILAGDLFDLDFFFYGEDVKLGFDLARRGIRFSECVSATVVHDGSASAKNGSMFYEYHMNRAHWLLARKLARNPFEHIVFVCVRCITLPLRATIRCARFRSFVPWIGLCAASVDVLRGRGRSFTPRADGVELSAT